jgi:hypothetical protein
LFYFLDSFFIVIIGHKLHIPCRIATFIQITTRTLKMQVLYRKCRSVIIPAFGLEMATLPLFPRYTFTARTTLATSISVRF